MISRRRYKNGNTSATVLGIETSIVNKIKNDINISIEDIIVVSLIMYDEDKLIKKCNYLLTKQTKKSLDMIDRIEIKTDQDYANIIQCEKGMYNVLENITSSMYEDEIFKYKYFREMKNIWDIFSEDEKINQNADKESFGF